MLGNGLSLMGFARKCYFSATYKYFSSERFLAGALNGICRAANVH